MANTRQSENGVVGREYSERLRLKLQGHPILESLIEQFFSPDKIDRNRVNLGLALLKKVVPDLQSVELTGANEGPISIAVKQYVIDPPKDD